jgi:hypothetical protein
MKAGTQVFLLEAYLSLARDYSGFGSSILDGSRPKIYAGDASLLMGSIN